MKKVLITVFLPLFAMSATVVSASTSESHVELHNVVDSSSSTSTSSDCQTDVYMNVNGEVKEYHSGSGNPCDVHMESDNGSSKVDINNNGQGSSTTVHQDVNGSSTVNITPTPRESSAPAKSDEGQKITQSAEKSTPKKSFIIQILMYIPEKIFKFLKFW